MPINYTQLATEITTDPKVLGFAALVAVGNDAAIAAALNLVRVGVDYQINRLPVPAYEIFEQIVPSEWAALTAAEKQRIQTLLSMGTVDPRGTNTRQAFQDAFGVGTTTRANLIAYLKRQASRAEVLFGDGVRITYTDVAKALRP